MSTFDKDVLRVIPSIFYMISSSSDTQQSEETYNTSNFELPNPAGKSGGACTSSFLQQQYEGKKDMSWVETLKQMRSVLKGMGYNQTPTLCSSRIIQPNSPMNIVPPQSGRRRALLIGINYVGQKGQLTACHNDCNNIREYLINVHGFREDEMLVLMDDGVHQEPTKENIETGMILLTKYSQPGDVVFISFSGHGGRVQDRSGDEDDGFDETLMPVDFMQNGQIVDDDILNMLVKPMKAGVTATVLMDCCHSGTVLDLPYKFGSEDRQMQREAKFDMSVVKEGIRKEMVSEKEWSEKKKIRKKESIEVVKKAQKRAEREEDKRTCGPKLAPNGQPVLPSRPAPANPLPPPPLISLGNPKKDRSPAAAPKANTRNQPKVTGVRDQQQPSPSMKKTNTASTKVKEENGERPPPVNPTKNRNTATAPKAKPSGQPKMAGYDQKQNLPPPPISKKPNAATGTAHEENDERSAPTEEHTTKPSRKFKMPSKSKKQNPNQEQTPDDGTAGVEEDNTTKPSHKFKMPGRNKKEQLKQEQAPSGGKAEDEDTDDPDKKCIIM